jgi:magnesium-transporting ATPase (P-type)
VVGENFINNEDEEQIDEFSVKAKIRDNTKDEILDENFKKAQEGKKFKKKEKKEKKKKPFLKSGIALIIIAVICLSVINYIPWLYVRYDSDVNENGYTENIYYRDFENLYNKKDLNISSLFELKNGSYQTGLSFDDFRDVPRFSSYGFYILLIIGLLFTIILIIDKYRDFNNIKINLFHSILSVITIAVCIYILLLLVKFIGAHILIFYNLPEILQSLPNIILIFPVPIMLIIITSGIMKIAFTILKINLFNLIKVRSPDSNTKKYIFRYKQGR